MHKKIIIPQKKVLVESYQFTRSDDSVYSSDEVDEFVRKYRRWKAKTGKFIPLISKQYWNYNGKWYQFEIVYVGSCYYHSFVSKFVKEKINFNNNEGKIVDLSNKLVEK
jgi:hypothetical protein